MNVILCYPPQKVYPGYGQEKRWLPLGIASLGAYIKRELPDVKVTLLDLFNYSIDDAFGEIKKYIRIDDINIVGFTCFTEQRMNVFELCDMVKTHSNVFTVIGGPHAFIMADQIIKNYPDVDFVIRGEGEKALVNLIKEINTMDWLGEGSPRIIEADPIHDLDSLPFSIDGFDLFANVPAEIEAEAPIVMSRGCTDYCSFCSTTKFWKGYRSRSASNVFEEMYKYDVHWTFKGFDGPRKFKFHDDASTADLENWKKLCVYIKKYNWGKKNKWEYEITARADQFDDELIELLARSGCQQVAVGIESGNADLRKAMNKNLDMDLAKQNIKKLMEAGIKVILLFIIGYPGENDGTVEETCNLIREINPSGWNIQPLMVFPGTKVYRDCLKWGWLTDDYWLQDLPQPYYLREQNWEKIKEWMKRIRGCMKKINVLIAAPVRQKDAKFKLYIERLNNLTVPDGVDVHRLFVLHNCEHLKEYVGPKDNVAIINDDIDYVTTEKTHEWKNNNLNFVSNIKNEIIDMVVKNGFDYVFFVDSDLILHPDTLKHLLEQQKQIIAELFWTSWNPGERPMPNAWDFDHYSFYPGTIEKYKTPGVYPCGGTGACILIHRSVFEAGVNYSFIPNVSMWGEDRHFSIRAMAAGFQLFVDTHYPATHLYRDSDVEKVVKHNV